ncbi:hypothetical protein G6011_09162 [Alternaria panax]|uniref:Uncharacterized protein n=1 Tax=Alternaria panax TaxID=48097 RepID=A0AAD4IAI8_9PLEO|nr:hypothetical protein G6011_09162 [Alternaria panax]
MNIWASSISINTYVPRVPSDQSLYNPFSASLKYAEDLIAKGEEKTIMPTSLIPSIITSPVTAYRWHSLVSIGDGFFSSDLPAATFQPTFGTLKKPTLILMSERDEMVPPTVDKEALLRRWIEVLLEGIASEQSQVIPNGDHELSEETIARFFIELVVEFLQEIEAEPVEALYEQ